MPTSLLYDAHDVVAYLHIDSTYIENSIRQVYDSIFNYKAYLKELKRGRMVNYIYSGNYYL